MSDEQEFYNCQNVLPRPILVEEYKALLQMFESAGWDIFKKLRTLEARSSNSIAVSLSADEVDRERHRALYHAFVGDLTFDTRLNDAVSEEVPVPYDEIDFDGYDPDVLGTMKM